jgi:hypothetical protein
VKIDALLKIVARALEDRLQDDGTIRVKTIMFIAGYAPVLPKTKTR